ncbi:MAG: hypothetical protein ACHP7O_06315 [Burkholderiales bacterium]
MIKSVAPTITASVGNIFPVALRPIVFAFLLTLTFGSLAAGQRIAGLTGIYSNLAYNKEGGDLLGMELMIIPSAEGAESTYTVFVQFAEGSAPFAAVVPLKVSGTKIEFEFPAASPYPGEHVVGAFTGKELVVRWSNGSIEHLKRGKSYWQ